MTSRIQAVFRYESISHFKRPAYLFFTFALPIIAIVVALGYQVLIADDDEVSEENDILNAEEAFSDGVRIAYVDQVGVFADLSPEWENYLRPFPDEESAIAALEADEIDVYYRIDTDFMESGDFTLVQKQLSITDIATEPIRQLIYGKLALELSEGEFLRFANPLQNANITVNESRGSNSNNEDEPNTTNAYIFVSLLAMGTFFTSGYLIQSIVEEKESRLIEIILGSVRPQVLLSGKVLALGMLGMLQVIVWGLAIALVASLSDQISALSDSFLGEITLSAEIIAVFLLYFVLGFMLYASIGGIIGALSSNTRDSQNLSVLYVLPGILPLSLLSILVEAPDNALAVGLSYFPLTAPSAMIIRYTISDVGVGELFLGAMILLISIAFMLWLAGRMFRVQTLLAGQRPKLSDIRHLLRQS